MSYNPLVLLREDLLYMLEFQETDQWDYLLVNIKYKIVTWSWEQGKEKNKPFAFKDFMYNQATNKTTKFQQMNKVLSCDDYAK